MVPIVIRNAGELMWRDAKTLRRVVVRVVVHAPIPTTGWSVADLPQRVERVRQLFIDTLDDWPQPPQEPSDA